MDRFICINSYYCIYIEENINISFIYYSKFRCYGKHITFFDESGMCLGNFFLSKNFMLLEKFREIRFNKILDE